MKMFSEIYGSGLAEGGVGPKIISSNSVIIAICRLVQENNRFHAKNKYTGRSHLATIGKILEKRLALRA
jgi:hypothetical protein